MSLHLARACSTRTRRVTAKVGFVEPLEQNLSGDPPVYSGLLLCLSFLFIMGPRLGRSDFGDIISGVSIVAASFLLLSKRSQEIPRSALGLILILWASVAYSGIIAVANGGMDLYSFLRSGRALVNFVGAIGVVSVYRSYYGRSFAWFIVFDSFLVIALHGVIMVLEFLLPELKDFVYAVTKPDNLKDAHAWSYDFRVAGLTSGGGAQTSFIQAIGLVLAPTLLSQRRPWWVKALLLLGLVFCFAGVNLSGRTGLYTGLFGLAVQISFYAAIGGSLGEGKAAPYILSVMSVGLLLVLISLVVLNVHEVLLPSYGVSLSRLIERNYDTARHIVATGDFEDSTVDRLFGTMYFLPDEPLALLFGTSNTGRGALGYIPSDAGYIRLLFSVGIVGSVLIYTFYVRIVTLSYRNYRVDFDLSSLSITLTLMILLVNAKEIVALSRHMFSISALFVIALLYEAEEVPVALKQITSHAWQFADDKIHRRRS